MCVRIQHSDVCAAFWKSERAWFERLPNFHCKHDARLSRVSHDGRPIIWAVSHLATPAYPHLPPYLSSSSPPTVSRSSDGSNRPTKFQVGTSYSSPAPHRHAMLRFFKTFHTKIIVILPLPLIPVVFVFQHTSFPGPSIVPVSPLETSSGLSTGSQRLLVVSFWFSVACTLMTVFLSCIRRFYCSICPPWK